MANNLVSVCSSIAEAIRLRGSNIPSQMSMSQFASYVSALPADVAYNDDVAFFNKTLTSYNESNSVVSFLPSNTFRSFSQLSQVSVPYVSSIGSYAFSDCSNLTSFTGSSIITEVGVGAFYNTRITSFNCENLNYIASSCFAFTCLSSISLPNIIYIYNKAFYSISALYSLPNLSTIQYLDAYAFAYCYHLSGTYTFSSIWNCSSFRWFSSTAFFECSMIFNDTDLVFSRSGSVVPSMGLYVNSTSFPNLQTITCYDTTLSIQSASIQSLSFYVGSLYSARLCFENCSINNILLNIEHSLTTVELMSGYIGNLVLSISSAITQATFYRNICSLGNMIPAYSYGYCYPSLSSLSLYWDNKFTRTTNRYQYISFFSGYINALYIDGDSTYMPSYFYFTGSTSISSLYFLAALNSTAAKSNAIYMAKSTSITKIYTYSSLYSQYYSWLSSSVRSKLVSF